MRIDIWTISRDKKLRDRVSSRRHASCSMPRGFTRRRQPDSPPKWRSASARSPGCSRQGRSHPGPCRVEYAGARREDAAVFSAVEEDGHSVFDAIKAIANNSSVKSDGGLSLEILAETCCNPSVADRLSALVVCYRDDVRRLAALTRLDATTGELEAYVEIMRRVGFFGLGQRMLLGPTTDVD